MLKYLFKATFTDDTTYSQNAEDVSVTGVGSCYTDINERAKNGEIKTFSLIGDHTYSVDLIDGHFEIDGLKFEASSELMNRPLTNYRLVYYRRVRRHFNPQESKEMGVDISYRFGWQSNDDAGKNYQQIIEIR